VRRIPRILTHIGITAVQLRGWDSGMSNRKNLKIDPDMYERLRDEKKKYETWNAFFDRLLEE
jgi:hypothetical protein